MAPYIPNIHDHVKAHQFKFVRGEKGTKMFIRNGVLTPCGVLKVKSIFLHHMNPVSLPYTPQVVPPLYDSEIVNKIETIISEIAAYLHKADALKWWKNWQNLRT